MMDDRQLEDIRREYAQNALDEKDINPDPIDQFDGWFQQAIEANLPDANAMTLATATVVGKPSTRIVLLKGVDENGFRFYTNYESRKGRELEENPQAALCFFWSQLERQVRIEGTVKKMSREESANYFHTRPRQSQLSAWASHQSAVISSRRALEEQYEEIKDRFGDEDIPLPDFWGGYVLQPSRIEFWQGRAGRLHDRIVYERANPKEEWTIERLAP